MMLDQYVLNTFMIYIFVKALILAPLGWMTLVYRWSERQARLDGTEQ